MVRFNFVKVVAMHTVLEIMSKITAIYSLSKTKSTIHVISKIISGLNKQEGHDSPYIAHLIINVLSKYCNE